MRSLGQFARVEELQEMLQEIDIDGKSTTSIDDWGGASKVTLSN